MAHVISNSCIAKKTVDYEDRGGNHDLLAHLMHSWVGYELVKVLLAFGLSPKLREDLNEFSPDLFNLFSYLGDKQQDSSKKMRLNDSFKFYSIRQNTAAILVNCHLEGKQISKNGKFHYSIGFINVATTT